MTFVVIAASLEYRQQLCYLLLSLGVQGFPAATVEEARRESDRSPAIDGFVIDVDADTPGGREMAGALKNESATREALLIVLTAQAEKSAIAAMAQAGAAGCLLKPLERPAAYESLKHILEHAAGERASHRRHIRVVPSVEDLLRLHFRVSGVPGLLSGKIVNLSMGGLACELVTPQAAGALKSETFIERLQFTLRGRELSPSGVIIAVKAPIVGIRFTALSEDDSFALARYIFDHLSS